MKKIRFLSALLTFCMVFGAIMSTVSLAAETEDTTASETAAPADDETTSDETTEGEDGEGEEEEEETIDYLQEVYRSPEEKLETMELKLDRFGYELYYMPFTGEVAVKNKADGGMWWSNPYDIAVGNTLTGKKPLDSIKAKLLSQICLQYNGSVLMNSYTEAALREQIKVKNVKNGIRVEYVMGRTETRRLLPKQIEKSRFEELILPYVTDKSKHDRIAAFYVLQDPDDPTLTKKGRMEMQASMPITLKMAIYTFDPGAVERELNLIEGIIKEFCPHYTYEELEYDHELTEYVNKDANPPLFRMAIEYYLDEQGSVIARLPANSVRFDEDAYTLTYISLLPYANAGSLEYTGYTFIPDGCGNLIRFEDILKQTTPRNISGQLYGQDFAYHDIGTSHQQVMRLPVFGLVEDHVYYPIPEDDEETEDEELTEEEEETELEEEEIIEEEEDTEELSDADSLEVPEGVEDTEDVTEDSEDGEDTEESEESEEPEVPADEKKEDEEPEEVEGRPESNGYLAIIEEGDALAWIFSEHGTNIEHKYNSVYARFYPRPTDSYNLASAISVSGDSTYTVTSDRRYTGSYRIRYKMLTDDTVAEQNNIKDYYPCTYVGMAHAYSDYLLDKGVIKPLENTNKDIPLYIETLGVIDVQERVATIPVMVKKALTTFDNLKAMTDELNGAGVNRIIYRLTGYTNGGMSNTVPYKVKFEKTVGGDNAYKDFLTYAKEKGVEVFPEFDISYAQNDKWFDGFSYKKDAVKTLDNRYIQKRTYSATLQYFDDTGLVAIAPAAFERIFDSFSGSMEKLGIDGVSLSTLGSDVNSDFRGSNPYNREDSKEAIQDVLEKFREAYGKVMVDAGNSFTLGYVDHVLNVSLDSSNYTYASEAIPFFGMVFHSYLNFAGTPTNMVGDIRYEKLRMIENGASPYFILVYQNEASLKNNEDFSKYYSLSYQIWKEDLIDIYKEMNEVLSDVQYSPIKNHEFIAGVRTPDPDEAENDAKILSDAIAEEEAKKKAYEESEERRKNYAMRKNELFIPLPYETDFDEEALREELASKYISDSGMITKVTYENGKQFILNYNTFAVTVEGYDIPALGYVITHK